MNRRKPEVDAKFPEGSRESLTSLFAKYNLTLVPHTSPTGALDLRARFNGGGEARHVATLNKFLALNEKAQQARLEEVRAFFLA